MFNNWTHFYKYHLIPNLSFCPKSNISRILHFASSSFSVLSWSNEHIKEAATKPHICVSSLPTPTTESPNSNNPMSPNDHDIVSQSTIRHLVFSSYSSLPLSLYQSSDRIKDHKRESRTSLFNRSTDYWESRFQVSLNLDEDPSPSLSCANSSAPHCSLKQVALLSWQTPHLSTLE